MRASNPAREGDPLSPPSNPHRRVPRTPPPPKPSDRTYPSRPPRHSVETLPQPRLEDTLYKVKAAQHEPVAERESALPSRDLSFDVETDVAVVGGGCAGFSSALFNAWNGEDVILL